MYNHDVYPETPIREDIFIFPTFQGAYSLVPTLLHGVLEKMIRDSNSSLFHHRTVKELLWGYKDPMLKEDVGLFLDVSKHKKYGTKMQINHSFENVGTVCKMSIGTESAKQIENLIFCSQWHRVNPTFLELGL